jgi:hypothetical protein
VTAAPRQDRDRGRGRPGGHELKLHGVVASIDCISSQNCDRLVVTAAEVLEREATQPKLDSSSFLIGIDRGGAADVERNVPGVTPCDIDVLVVGGDKGEVVASCVLGRTDPWRWVGRSSSTSARPRTR